MIRLAVQVGVHQVRAFGAGGVAIGGFQGHEDGINFAKKFGIVALEDPALLRFVVGIEDAQAPHLLVLALLHGPDAVLVIGLLDLGVAQVVGVEDQALALREKDSSERGFGFAVGVGINHVDNV